MTLGIIVRDGTNTPRTITEIFVRDASNTPREITEIWVRDDSNTPRLVFNPSGSATLSVSVSPTAGSGFSFGTGIATTENPNVATPSGGTAPYTYAWEIVSYTSLSGPPAINSPTSASTDFTQSGIDPNTTVSAQAQVVVTDDNGAMVTSDPVSLYFSDVS
jgi:hypothetical protein